MPVRRLRTVREDSTRRRRSTRRIRDRQILIPVLEVTHNREDQDSLECPASLRHRTSTVNRTVKRPPRSTTTARSPPTTCALKLEALDDHLKRLDNDRQIEQRKDHLFWHTSKTLPVYLQF
uniref:(northern house mosquito) hypothetical protein n=1 Tax=Culex pipiens TaxID=7175 RepID=A0A8D8J6R3_CULPI